MNELIEIVKLNPLRQETWRYTGRVLFRGRSRITIEAFFDRPDMPFHGLILGKGDRFVETYFARRWYNILEIHDRQDDAIKGWYCNVTLPAEIKKGQVSYVDLALDLLVYPDGQQLVLDEGEFVALALDTATCLKAKTALNILQRLVIAGRLAQISTGPYVPGYLNYPEN